MGYVLLGLAIIPALIFGGAWVWNWPILIGAPNPNLADRWSMVGVLMGYWGVLFSGYAAYQVRVLSQKYFARMRFPQIKESIDTITSNMARFDRSAAELRSEKFLASIPVSLGEVERVPGHKMSALIKRATFERRTLIEWINQESNRRQPVNEEAKYWDLCRTLLEISQEITAHIKEQGAR